MSDIDTRTLIEIRATVNQWLMANFTTHREYLCHHRPVSDPGSGGWLVSLATKKFNGRSIHLGTLALDDSGAVVRADDPAAIARSIDRMLESETEDERFDDCLEGPDYRFAKGDGVQAAGRLPNESIDLLLTDPPYGISAPYGCESQIPRRLRTNGRDFIMPKGNFGDWDKEVDPEKWLNIVLPKVSGWTVSFCAQAQIGAYQACLREHRFVAVGTLVWQKTNPVPFNAKHKPVNAWEAIVVGKRPGTKFHGNGVVHNVFKYRSPSPQIRIHPTQKPLDLLVRFVEMFSAQGQTVFDPFAGSGSTLIAAVHSQRKAIGYEASEKIYQAACARIEGEIDARFG
ncbi:DNA-methyltransferase [Thioalkalivibrio sp. HK1]|uniref:DNA-methyltransferase n=1 Tax=Thioalkalivibrio sp. HK1 TaxID=1469245 RepID=UPI00046E914B|nr:site-specific DNA-methyltransferase [Thioalkalivibrio sp. HK1]